METEYKHEWRIHLQNLLSEIGNSNSQLSIMGKPLTILGNIMHRLGECSARINDPELNEIMCRLTIYTIADPENKEDYNPKLVDKIFKISYAERMKRKLKQEKQKIKTKSKRTTNKKII